MIYIVSTLKNAAHAFVDSYKFHKTQAGNFSLFNNDAMHLIFSDSGVQNARLATQALINLYDITDEDIYLYIGACEDCSIDEEGSFLQVDSSIYTSPEDDSFGFYDAVIHSPAIKNFYIFKVLSGHFEAEEEIEMLLERVMEKIAASLRSSQ
ncbi:MAG: hypothetical protein PHU40_04005 [Sulfurimonas sp.]|jgi:hypothetical protein|nr:hypothetical protein [Sulfurimonas sp.]